MAASNVESGAKERLFSQQPGFTIHDAMDWVARAAWQLCGRRSSYGAQLDFDVLVQEAMERIWKKHPFPYVENPVGYVMGITLNTYIELVRHHERVKRAKYESVPLGERALDVPDMTGRNPEELAIQEACLQALRDAIAKLPPHLWQVVELRLPTEEGGEVKTYKEIGRILDIPEGTGKSRMAEASRLLREDRDLVGYRPDVEEL